jgi:hypothetical protein
MGCTALRTEGGDDPEASGHEVPADTILKNLST